MEHRVQSSNLLNPHKPLMWIAGAALVAVTFASGALAARAFGDDDDTPGSPGVVVPGIAKSGDGSSGQTLPAPYGPNDVITNGGRGGANTVPYPGCRAPLPAGVLTNGTIDFSKATFGPSLPKAGFSALGISFSAQGECDKDGKATSGDLVLDTSWLHDSSGIDAYVSQRKTDKKQASVLRPDSAVFWSDGYLYTVGVNIYRALPAGAADGSGVSPARDDGSSSPGSTGGSAPGYEPQMDPRAAQVLAELIAQVAPSVDQKCFWALGAGDWSSLAAAGIGDPRPAIPSGYSEAGVSVTSFTAPPAGCDTSLKPTDGFSFNASWQKNGANSNDFAYLGVSVYANPVATPGRLSDYGANWSNGSFQFAVYAKANKPVGLDTIRAIAKALDPTFDEKCFIQQRELKESELDGLGFHAAKAPSGYSLQRTSLQATEIAAGCPKPEGFETSYNLNWSFQKGADTIEAGANRYGGQGKGDGSGFQSPNSLNWTDASGTNYFVNGSSTGISPNVSKDDLVFIAKSMDPAFDLKKLQEGGGPKDIVPPVAPQPAPDKPR